MSVHWDPFHPHRTSHIFRVAVLGGNGHGKTALAFGIHETVYFGNCVSWYPSVQKIEMPTVDQFEIETYNRFYKLYDFLCVDEIKKCLGAFPEVLDAAILVVPAESGVEQEHEEQLILARLAGVPSVIAYLSKCDLVNDSELVELAEKEVREMMVRQGYGTSAIPVIRGRGAPRERAAEEQLRRGYVARGFVDAGLEHAVAFSLKADARRPPIYLFDEPIRRLLHALDELPVQVRSATAD